MHCPHSPCAGRRASSLHCTVGWLAAALTHALCVLHSLMCRHRGIGMNRPKKRKPSPLVPGPLDTSVFFLGIPECLWRVSGRVLFPGHPGFSNSLEDATPHLPRLGGRGVRGHTATAWYRVLGEGDGENTNSWLRIFY